jgi:hypothetical protein
VPTQIVVDSVVRQRAQEDQKRKYRPKEIGPEPRRPVGDVERLQPGNRPLYPGSLQMSAGGFDPPLGSRAHSNFAASSRRRKILPRPRPAHVSHVVRAWDRRPPPGPDKTRPAVPISFADTRTRARGRAPISNSLTAAMSTRRRTSFDLLRAKTNPAQSATATLPDPGDHPFPPALAVTTSRGRSAAVRGSTPTHTFLFAEALRTLAKPILSPRCRLLRPWMNARRGGGPTKRIRCGCASADQS